MKSKKYRILLGGGIVASAIVPVIAVLSCGEVPSFATQAEVDAEQERINGLATTPIERASAIDEVTAPREVADKNSADVLATFGLNTTLNFNKFAYFYVNDALPNDGSLKFTITVKNKALLPLVGANPSERTVTVTGIALARVNAEQDRINNLAVGATVSLSAIPAVTAPLEINSINRADVLKKFGLVSTTDFDFATFSYWYTNSALAVDGDLHFTIGVKDKTNAAIAATNPKPLERTVAVTGFTTLPVLQDLVNAEQNRINILATNPIATASIPIPAVISETEITSINLAEILAKFWLPSGTIFDFGQFRYTYTNTGLNADGDLHFTISVKDKTGVVAATNPVARERTVAVTGINLAVVNAEQDRINKLATSGPVIRTTSIPAVTTETEITSVNRAEILTEFGLASDTIFDFGKFSYWYTNTSLTLDGDLHFTISVKDKAGVVVATNPVAQERTVAVVGIGVLASPDEVNLEQEKVNTLQTHTVIAGAEGIAANNYVTATYELTAQLGIVGFWANTGKFSYVLSNPSLLQDGTLEVTIRVSSRVNPALQGTPRPIRIAVTGIIKAQEQADQDYLKTVVGSSLNGHAFANVYIREGLNVPFADANTMLYMTSPDGGAVTLPYPNIEVKVSKSTPSIDVSYTIGANAPFIVQVFKFAPISLDEFNGLYPGQIVDNKVAVHAFFGRELPVGFSLPENITAIGDYAFSRQSMFVSAAKIPISFAIPESVTSIGEGAFEYAILPDGFIIPELVTSIGNGAFQHAVIPVGFAIPKLVTAIASHLFYEATIPNDFTIPESVTSIGDNAFFGVTLPVGFVIPKTVTSIDPNGFLGSKLPAGYHWEKDGAKFSGWPVDGGHRYDIVAD